MNAKDTVKESNKNNFRINKEKILRDNEIIVLN